MSPLLPLGLAIALNATVLGAGLVLIKRQAKRMTAEGAAGARAMYQLEPLPPAGHEVLILVEEDDGRSSEIEGVHWPHLGWTDAVTLLPVEDDVLGWRRNPIRREPPTVDYAGWTDEDIAAEIERRTGDGCGHLARGPYATMAVERLGRWSAPMSEEKDALPSDAEDGGLKPKPVPQDRKQPRPQDDEKTEEDPSEQPS